VITVVACLCFQFKNHYIYRKFLVRFDKDCTDQRHNGEKIRKQHLKNRRRKQQTVDEKEEDEDIEEEEDDEDKESDD
jgi:hypothetical protein